MCCLLGRTPVTLLLVAMLLLGPAVLCASDQETDRQTLLRLHQEVLQAHRNNDLDTWMESETDDYVMVNRGSISTPDKAARRERLAPYLNSTTFAEYRDLVEPIVHLSEDGSLGWLIAQVRIVGTQKLPEGAPETFESTWAWIELYEKRHDKWLRIGNVSNVQP